MARLLCNLRVVGICAAIVLLLASRLSDAATCYAYLSQNDYPYCITLDENLVLHWRIIENKTLELAPDGDGYMSWIAIGITDMGMKGVDYNIAIRSSEGQNWVTSDFFALDNSTPVYDMEQNTNMDDAPTTDANNHTLAVFDRPLDSCDTEDVPVFLNVERSIAWAYNWDASGHHWDKDKLAFANYTRGIVNGIKLFPDSAAAASGSAATTTVTVAMPSLPVAAANSSVVCVNMALPKDAAYHVVSYQGFNTTPFVTRVMGYVCGTGVPAPPLGVPYSCSPPSYFLSERSALPPGCETLNFVWAPGAGAFTAPPQAGFAIGAGSAAVIVLQVYYQNPAGVVGKTDSSGFNLTYTSELRNASLGVLTLGNLGLRLEPNNSQIDALPSICPASCTSRKVMAPATLVSNFYVMGNMGLSQWTRHIRNGTAIQPLGRINYWDRRYMFYQTTFPDSGTLLANDTLITICSYNTSSKTRGSTKYGDGPDDELCFNYVTFYPVTSMPNLDYCVSYPRLNTSTCATRTQLAAMAASNATDAQQLQNGTKVVVGTLNITYFKTDQCILHDSQNVRPYHKPNTRAAVASIVLVPITLIIVGAVLWSKYSKEEELEALLAKARQEGLDTALTAE